jgi:histidinol phosphatase-like enzyme (inositol monophosphatase family)
MGDGTTWNAELLAHGRVLAESAARAGGAVALQHFRRADLRVETKGDGSPVSVADRAAEEEVRRVLAADDRLGDLDVLGEEHGESGAGSALRWIIDPIDGTFLFINGVPQWGTLVALEDVARAQPVVGVVHFPAIDHCYTAARGLGASRNGTPIRTQGFTDPGHAIVQVPDQASFERRGLGAALAELRSAYPRTRGYADCYGHAMAAEGAYAAAVDLGLAPWDLAASQVLVQEAGGVVVSRPAVGGRPGADAILGHEDVVPRVAAILGF